MPWEESIPESGTLDAVDKDLIWQRRYEALVFAHFYATLSSRYARFVSRVRWINGLLCLASALTLASRHELAEIPALLLAASAGAVTMWDILWRISEKAREATSLHLAWDRLASRYLALWRSVHDPNSDGALQDLEDRRAELEQRQTYLDHSKRWHHRQMETSAQDVRTRLYPNSATHSTEESR